MALFPARGAMVTWGGEKVVFDIPVAYQIAIVAAALAGLTVWLIVFARAERHGRGGRPR